MLPGARTSAVALTVLVAFVVGGCSGRTTGAIDLTAQFSGAPVTATLTAVGSCDQSCTAFMRWRRVGETTWTNSEPFNSGPATNAPWKRVATGLSSGATYEYQACGKESSMGDFVCVGPSGRPNEAQKFLARPGADAWPGSRYDRALSGRNPFEVTLGTANANALSRAWTARFSDPGAVVGSPVVARGVVYVTVSPTPGTSYLAAYPAFCKTGGGSCDPLWRGPIGGTNAGAAPAVADGKVYVGGDKLYVFSASGCFSSTCPPLWTGTTGGEITSSPTVSGGSVYVGTGGNDRRLYAFSSSGCNQPSCPPSGSQPTFGAVSTAAVGPVLRGTGVIASAARSVYTFTDGGTLVLTQTAEGNVTAPLLAGGLISVGSADGRLYAFEVLGRLAWTGATGGPIVAAPAYADGVFYVGSGDGKLYAFSASCGTGGSSCAPLWTGTTGGPFRSSPTVANGVVYVGSSDGRLYEFADAGCGSATCPPLASQATGGAITPGSSPVVANGVVYLGVQDASGASLQAFSLP